MSWASTYVKQLQEGLTISFRPRGNSMAGKINSGDLCTVEPIKDHLYVGDIVLCKVRGKDYLHLISAIRDAHYQISNNRGHINGWITNKNIYGRLINVQR
jgi:phage repressor protein C with HTH and peptisase S24 domain